MEFRNTRLPVFFRYRFNNSVSENKGFVFYYYCCFPSMKLVPWTHSVVNLSSKFLTVGEIFFFLILHGARMRVGKAERCWQICRGEVRLRWWGLANCSM